MTQILTLWIFYTHLTLKLSERRSSMYSVRSDGSKKKVSFYPVVEINLSEDNPPYPEEYNEFLINVK